MSSWHLSKLQQVVITFGFALGLCVVAFFAGKLLNPTEKYKINAVQANSGSMLEVQNRVEVLENDISMLEEYLRALHKYDNFILYDNKRFTEFQVPENYGGDKISELEIRRNELLASVQVRAFNRINAIEKILSSAGFSYAKLTGKSSPVKGVGGPFVPVNLEEIDKNREMYTGEDFFSELKYLYELEKIMSHMPFSLPMKSFKLTSGFGVRRDPFFHSYALHSGLDFVGSPQARVVATALGTVVKAGWESGYGQMIEINHGYGVTTRYAHLSAIRVKLGQRVGRGQQIGNQGSTGRSTGAHLHYEVRINGLAVNPAKFVSKAKLIYFYEPDQKI